MKLNQIKISFTIAALSLFTLSCGSGPTEVATENNNESEVVMQEETVQADATQNTSENAGSIKIADLVNNPESYAGKTVQLTGTCTKVNTAILGLNWIHLQDGSKDDFDLVITTDANVPVGNTVTMTGVVALNKDFGYGYSYEIIVEEGKVVE